MNRLLRFLRHWRNWFGLVLLALMVSLAIATPALAPQADPALPVDFNRVGSPSDPIPHPPNENAILGTLSGQYDVFFTLLWGLRQAFKFGLTATLITAVFGILYGATSAYLGGGVNNTMMRIADAFLTFPVLAAIAFLLQIRATILVESGAFILFNTGEWYFPVELSSLQVFFRNFNPVMWSLILFSWMPYARLVNASVLRLRNTDYVLSARALGAGNARIILRHLLPNAISPEIVLAARDVGGMVILQATFTFIGMGGTSPWGSLLAAARNWVVGPGGNPLMYWWTYLPTTLALILFGLTWNFIGDSLNEWINPRKLIL